MSESSEEKVVLKVESGAATIRFNRADARNALDPESMSLLSQHLETAAKAEDIRVVVLTGTGSTFSAGADLKAALAGSEGGFTKSGPEAMADLLTQIADHPKPTIQCPNAQRKVGVTCNVHQARHQARMPSVCGVTHHGAGDTELRNP